MNDFLYYTELYDIYKKLLTNKQQQYFEDYYFNNFSLSEMSENYAISRNAISKQLNVIRDKLDDYEKKLELKTKRDKIYRLLLQKTDGKIAEQIKDII